MATYHLRNWSVSADPWTAPEVSRKQLSGLRDNETKPVITSSIVKVEGRKITTNSGSVYILEDIDPEYLAWMKENGIEYNEENPIKLKN